MVERTTSPVTGDDLSSGEFNVLRLEQHLAPASPHQPSPGPPIDDRMASWTNQQSPMVSRRGSVEDSYLKTTDTESEIILDHQMKQHLPHQTLNPLRFPGHMIQDLQGSLNGLGTSNTLSEFTKRKNWSQRILEELQDLLQILTEEGRTIYATPSAKAMTGYGPDELVSCHLWDFLHPEDKLPFMRDFHESVSTGRTLRGFYRFKKSDNTFITFEANGHPHYADFVAGQSSVSTCKGFFLMSRPYPTKNASLLDSFLEHKFENARLNRRINELRKEEEDAELNSRLTESVSVSDSGNTLSIAPGEMAPPAKPMTSNALTRQNLDKMEAANTTRAFSIRDKMARLEGGSPMETIEMLTGLRYSEGERSKGISTGDMSPSLIRGDIGVPFSAEKELRAGWSEKKKKHRKVDEYVCTDCGTLESPEWRKGPKGPKTLCNACGLRYSKRMKRGSQNPDANKEDLKKKPLSGQNSEITEVQPHML